MNQTEIRSPWAFNGKKRQPLSCYPRPALIRKDWVNLNGYWEYVIRTIESETEIPESWNGRILVPFAPETALSGIQRALHPGEELWYRRRFIVPPSWLNRSVLLNFEAVDYFCRCFVNGRVVGEHRGGYQPFSFDITDALKDGDNTVVLRVEDPTDTGMQPRGKQVCRPDKIWYESTSGIWQTVWMEPVNHQGHLEDVSGTWSQSTKILKLTSRVRPGIKGDVQFRADVLSPTGETVKTVDSSKTSFEIDIPEPELWSPDHPYLYGLKVKMYIDGCSVDEIRSYTALRAIDAVPGNNGHKRIRINGRPIFINGLLDQGYWPESGMTAPDDEALLFDIQETKKLGFNCLRKHIKIESRRWYYHADRLGMLVIQDMVSGGRNWTNAHIQIGLGLHHRDTSRFAYRRAGRSNPGVKKEFEKSVEDTVLLLRKHPSIICWVPFNESWGQYDSSRIGKRVAEIDRTRLVDHASGWLDQGGGDFYSIHRYQLKLKPKPTQDSRVHIVSECGGYNYSVPGHLWSGTKQFGYGKYDSPVTLSAAYSELIRKQVMPLIDRGLSGVIYTQLSDVETEINGLFSYDRKVLKFERAFLQHLNEEMYEVFSSLEGASKHQLTAKDES